MSVPAGESRVQAVLLDIEGTTTPVEFVYQVLFPYARKQARDFLLRHQAAPDVQDDIEALQKEHALDLAQGLEPLHWRVGAAEAVLNSAVTYFHWLMDRDRKSTGLKSLQGKIWDKTTEQASCAVKSMRTYLRLFPGGANRKNRFAYSPRAACLLKSCSSRTPRRAI